MAKLVFGMNQSLDGYVDHMAFAPGPKLFRHFIEEAKGQAGSVYGRVMYEIMRYWDDDHPEWGAEEQAFAAAWRKQPKWVVSRSLKEVGRNATLVGDDLEDAIRELKAGRDGEIEVAGPGLAHSLTELGLIDEYRIYLHPVVLGQGTPYFAGPRPPLRLMAVDRIDEDVLRLAYVPAYRRLDGQRWEHPGQQQGRRLPSRRLSEPQSMRLRRVSAFLADVTQQIHSLRASGVMSCHVINASGSWFSASLKSSGSSWTTPPGMFLSPVIGWTVAAFPNPGKAPLVVIDGTDGDVLPIFSLHLSGGISWI